MSYLTGLYADLIDIGPDDGRVVAVTTDDLNTGHLELPRRHDQLAVAPATTRWTWDGTVNDSGHYRFRRAVPSEHRSTTLPRHDNPT